MMRALRRRSRQRGQSLVELALIMPMFALMLFALLDFGRVVYAQNTVSQAAREASRVGSLEPSASASKYAAMRSAAVSKAPGLGLTSSDVTGQGCADCFYPDGAMSGGRVVVTVAKPIQLLTPIVSQIVGGSFTVTSTALGFIP